MSRFVLNFVPKIAKIWDKIGIAGHDVQKNVQQMSVSVQR